MKNKNIEKYVKSEKELMDAEYELICKLVSIRKENGLSQRDLCSIIDFYQPTLARIEKGKHSPVLNTLIKILSTMGYKIEFVKEKGKSKK